MRGKALLYAHCASHHVPHQRIGKIVVATSEAQFAVLESYQRQARINGAGELPWLDRDEVLALEPEVDALAGVYSESTGIIDSHAYTLSLVGELEAAGGMIAFLSEVTALRRWSSGVRVCCDDFALDADLVVNAAGLNAPAMAARLGGHHRGYYAKGHYYTLSGKSPFSRLVYPVAEAGGLGVHVTLDLAGQARFGPGRRLAAGRRLRLRRIAPRPLRRRHPPLLPAASTNRACTRATPASAPSSRRLGAGCPIS